ncbi:type II secretion system F family protein [Legionella pneumophila serogroup 1]
MQRTPNIIYAKATDKIREEVATGQQMFIAMENTHLFPNMVIQMVAIGEESGALEKMLSKVADFYEEEVNNAVDALSSLLEPIIMSILGILVGGLVVAMYLPIFKLGSAV